MLVALTGTPGTGKTSVGCFLSDKGYPVWALADLGKHCIVGYDNERECAIYDLDLMAKQICDTNGIVFLEGHFSHLLSGIDKVIVLRCYPDELQKRLGAKGWSSKKILENIESEALDIIRCDINGVYPKENILEIDTTNITIQAVGEMIEAWVQYGFQGVPKKIDWSNWVVEHAG